RTLLLQLMFSFAVVLTCNKTWRQSILGSKLIMLITRIKSRDSNMTLFFRITSTSGHNREFTCHVAQPAMSCKLKYHPFIGHSNGFSSINRNIYGLYDVSGCATWQVNS